jgi:carbon monoxide dehydrogenase subunit G
VVVASIGPISTEFFGLIRVTRQTEFEELCLAFEGKGGVAGFVKGTARVILISKSAVLTQLRYSTSSQIGGRLAQVGSRLVEGVVRRTSESFFTNLVQNLVATNADEGSSST